MQRGTDDGRVVAARKGSSPAFEELYPTHAGWVAQMACAGASRDHHVVADIVQEVFTRALENLDRLRDPSRFGAWVYAIANHVIVDHHRVTARSRPLDDERAEQIESGDARPEALAEAAELAGLLRRSVAGLSHRDATAIVLVSSRGLSPRSWARCSVSAGVRRRCSCTGPGSASGPRWEPHPDDPDDADGNDPVARTTSAARRWPSTPATSTPVVAAADTAVGMAAGRAVDRPRVSCGSRRPVVGPWVVRGAAAMASASPVCSAHSRA